MRPFVILTSKGKISFSDILKIQIVHATKSTEKQQVKLKVSQFISLLNEQEKKVEEDLRFIISDHSQVPSTTYDIAWSDVIAHNAKFIGS